MTTMKSRTGGSATRRRGRSRALRDVLLVLLLACLALPLLVAGRVVQVAGRDEQVPAGAIVVLGAAQLDGEPGQVLTARLKHSLALYRAGLAPVVVTTGGSRAGDRFTEAAAGARWLVDNGVPAEAVVAVPVGSNTLSSLYAVAEVAREQGWASMLMVTDPWHTYRVLTMSETVGLPVEGASPATTGPGARSVSDSVGYLVRETAAVLVHHARQLARRLG